MKSCGASPSGLFLFVALAHGAPSTPVDPCRAAIGDAALSGSAANSDVCLLQREASLGGKSGRHSPKKPHALQGDWQRWELKSGKGAQTPGAPELLQVQAAVTPEYPPSPRNETPALFSIEGTTAVAQYVQWRGDIFGEEEHLIRVALFDGPEAFDWWSFIAIVIVLLLVDIFILQTICSRGTMCQHVAMIIFWFFVGACFAAFVYYRHGTEMVWQWLSGYLLEWLLSMDNLFVFHIIFKSYVTPTEVLHKALFIGILGAITCRLVFFVMLHNLLHLHNYFRYVFGALLLYSGIKAVSEDDDDEEDPTTSTPVVLLKRCLGDRLYEGYDLPNGAIFILRNGKWCATLMVPVIFCLEVTDVLFAVDSVSAKVAQIPDQFMNYSSSVMAMFGIRALYFLLDDILRLFSMMKYGLCFILVFIGIELMLSDYVKLPASCVTVMLFSVFVVSVGASLAVDMFQKRSEGDAGAEGSEEKASCFGR